MHAELRELDSVRNRTWKQISLLILSRGGDDENNKNFDKSRMAERVHMEILAIT
jgi:hypothetical protein